MLKALWRSWFGPRVMPGQKWTFDDSDEKDNPFRRASFCIKVIDVKGRWVLYHFEYGSNRSLRIGIFRFCYKLSV
jgi:hypothetical protein